MSRRRTAAATSRIVLEKTGREMKLARRTAHDRKTARLVRTRSIRVIFQRRSDQLRPTPAMQRSDKKYQQQQEKQFAKQDQERQKLQQRQDKEDQRLAQRRPMTTAGSRSNSDMRNRRSNCNRGTNSNKNRCSRDSNLLVRQNRKSLRSRNNRSRTT